MSKINLTCIRPIKHDSNDNTFMINSLLHMLTSVQVTTGIFWWKILFFIKNFFLNLYLFLVLFFFGLVSFTTNIKLIKVGGAITIRHNRDEMYLWRYDLLGPQLMQWQWM